MVQRNDRFYVYHHVVEIEFSFNEVLYKKGTVVYVGSGTGNRYKSKLSRTKDHLTYFDNLKHIIVYENLSFTDKFSVEEDEINKYIGLGFLFNRRSVNRPLRLDVIGMSEILEYSPESPSGLLWKVNVGRGGSFKPKGSVAGGLCNSTGYWLVTVSGTIYKAHRLVWSICNNSDISDDLVIDHIDRNPSNNLIANLQAVPHYVNSQNLKLRKDNKYKLTGIRKSACGNYWMSYIRFQGELRFEIFKIKDLGEDLAKESAIKSRESMVLSVKEFRSK